MLQITIHIILRYFLLIIVASLFSLQLNAQHFTHDIGIFAGQSSLQADYGARDNYQSTFGNKGLSFSVAHYLHFFNKSRRWNSGNEIYNSLAVKTELNYLSTIDLKNFGEHTEGTSPGAISLRAMTGSVSMLSLGVNLEYYLFNLGEFIHPYSDIRWNPYVTFGARYSLYTNTLESSLGDWTTDKTLLIQKYRAPGALAVGEGAAISALIGGGFRFKLTEKLDFSTLLSFQYMFSDSVDGLQVNDKSNKFNETLINFEIGVVYHLNFYEALFR